jgi:uncharacterized protein YjbI with pentapeptide repeats
MTENQMRPFLTALLLAALPSASLAEEALRSMSRCGGCTIADADYTGASLMGIDLSEATVTGTRFDNARMAIALFDEAILEGVSFDGADLDGASFVGARLTGVTFVGADLSGAVFDEAVLVDTDLSVSRRCQTQLPDDVMANDNCGED